MKSSPSQLKYFQKNGVGWGGGGGGGGGGGVGGTKEFVKCYYMKHMFMVSNICLFAHKMSVSFACG